MPVPTMSSRAVPSESATTPHGGRRGRRPGSTSLHTKLERSRQNARECRERKKLRYQYLEELIANREKAIFSLREELEMIKAWCIKVDTGTVPLEMLAYLTQQKRSHAEVEASATSKVNAPCSKNIDSVKHSSMTGQTAEMLHAEASRQQTTFATCEPESPKESVCSEEQSFPVISFNSDDSDSFIFSFDK